MLYSLPGIIGNLIAAAVCFSAMTFGGRTERFAGALLIVVNFSSAVVQSRSDWAGLQLSIVAIDCATFAVAIVMVLRTDRAWTVGLAAYYGLMVATHFAMLLEPAGRRPDVRTWIYITGLVTWGYLSWACLAWGTYSAWRRREGRALHQT